MRLLGIALVLVSLFNLQCKKEELEIVPMQHVVEGYLYEDCDLTPVVNQKLVLETDQPNIGNGLTIYLPKIKIADAWTDENGYYKFTYTAINIDPRYSIDLRKGGLSYLVYLGGIPLNFTPPPISLFVNNSSEFDVYLDVRTPFTSEDSLIYHDENDDRHIFYGPFSSQYLYSVVVSSPSSEQNWNFLDLGMDSLGLITPRGSITTVFAFSLKGPNVLSSPYWYGRPSVTHNPCEENIRVDFFVQ